MSSFENTTKPTLAANMDIDSDSDEDKDCWSESDGDVDELDENFSAQCLFCNGIVKTVKKSVQHLKDNHNVHLKEIRQKFRLDCYSYIKMINYIRLHKTNPEELLSMTEPQWTDDKYLKGSEFDSWLTLDIEDFGDLADTTSCNFNDSHDLVRLNSLVESLTIQLKEKNSLLEQAAMDMATMRQGFRNLMEKVGEVKPKDDETVNCVGSISVKADESYFSSYAHYGIHYEMLSDEVRTSSYRDALLGNSELLKGKLVLDLGCGTSILSMFASKAGAETIVAIDNSEIIYHAMDIAKKNNFDNIKFVKGRLEDTELPIDKFDVIVSEWMGYFLVFEGMLDSIIYARNRHLKLGGTMIPNRCNISIVGHGDEVRHQQYIGFWKNVYEFDMSCMQKEVLREAVIEISKPEFVLTNAEVIVDYDLMKVDANYSNFSYDFNLKVLKSGRITSFVGYFDTFFDLPNKVFFSTSPETPATHWKQVTFFIRDPVTVNENEVITGTITCNRSIRDLRSLTVKIKVFGKEFHYMLD